MNYILAHFIGDYILQTDEMALNKKRPDLYCGIHVVFYMVPFLLCDFDLWQLILIAIQHYVIDRTNFVVWFMKWKGSETFATGPCSPWSVIVIDNILHILWIDFIVFLPKILWV